MKKIAELTAEQESLLVVYRDRGIAEGLCTDRIDEDFARGYASRLMKALKRDHVATVCLGGPVETWYAVLMLSTGDQVGYQVRNQVRDQVGD